VQSFSFRKFKFLLNKMVEICFILIASFRQGRAYAGTLPCSLVFAFSVVPSPLKGDSELTE
jgi:hypothetical protein